MLFQTIFVENVFKDSLVIRQFKRIAFIWIYLGNIIHVFSVTFSQYNASLLNRNIIILNLTDSLCIYVVMQKEDNVQLYEALL